MNIIHTIILGIVEGVTEFLPISSTAHLLVTERLMGIVVPESFTIGIQAGAIAAAALVSRRLLRNPRVWRLVIVGAIPTLIAGFLLKSYVSNLSGMMWLIAAALIIGGIIMIIFPIQPANGSADTKNLETISYQSAFMIGLGQVASFIPGVSRSAATIYTARVQGISIFDAVRYSFVLALPVMGAATLYSLYSEYKLGELVNYDWGSFIIGSLVAAVIAYIAMKWLLAFIQKYSWKWFGYYRIVVGVIVLLLMR